MASTTRTWHEDFHPSQSEMERAVEESLGRLQFWSKSQLSFGVSLYDFLERIVQDLTPRWQGPLDPASVDKAVQTILKQLAYNDRRRAFRRDLICSPVTDIDRIADPKSLNFASKVELDSQVKAVREHIENVRPDLQPVIDRLFGFLDEDKITVAKLAKQLKIKPATLRQRLHRLYAELRTKL
jgi:hypothetical protein